MAVIRWKPSAWQLFNGYLENARIVFGRKTAMRWEKEIIQIHERLKKHPTSYPPEELLQETTVLYRRCHIMNRRFKIIYTYDEDMDIVHIMDIWDTKRNPKTLIKRIK